MDDLLGEDWQAPAKQPTTTKSPNPSAFASNFSSLRTSPQIPLSNASTPLSISRPSSTVTGGATNSKSSAISQKKAGDAFGNLSGLKSQSNTSTGSGLSIQERQRQLVDERNRQLQEQGQFWDNLGSKTTGQVSTSLQQHALPADDEDDILAAFNKDVKVDRSSHFPPPSQPESGRGTPAIIQTQHDAAFDDVDDDTFGLGQLKSTANGHVKSSRNGVADVHDDDDILGELGAPVKQKPSSTTRNAASTKESMNEWDENVAQSQNRQRAPRNEALNELIEMGFAEETARIALSENSGDVQRSVGWLLQQAHAESQREAREQRQTSPRRNGSRPAGRSDSGSMQSWMQTEARASSSSRRQDGRQAGGEEKDASQMAQEFGSKLFKSAGSLWKASQKQMAKTIADFQQDRDPNQPKWMQNGNSDRPAERANGDRNQRRSARPSEGQSATNEAALLDMPREDDARRSRPTVRQQAPAEVKNHAELPARRRENTAMPSSASASSSRDGRAGKLSRQAIEDQSAQAYVSPARRKRTTPKPEVQQTEEAEVDLFSPEPVKSELKSQPTRSTPQPVTVRPKASARQTPSVSSSALSTSSKHRQAGGEAFKRGDYGAAHEAYTAALTPLPPSHPIVIIILSNRALTALKTGDAKMAVSDADRALELIGPAQGKDETIVVEAGSEGKDMKEFFGKALMRKAEALEHQEKWSEAGEVWKQAVEAGVGGAISIRGKQRCEKASTPAISKPPARSSTPAKPSAARPTTNSAPRAKTVVQTSDEAVKKLRAANAAAEKADDEKFRLADQVDARLTTWKGGKADNLRALLQSMDTVLWPEAGWKKVGMSDLVMPNKVKIIYMKAIAKVHPDKIAQDASIEQRMVSAAVFSTLNEAWDTFKKQNNL